MMRKYTYSDTRAVYIELSHWYRLFEKQNRSKHGKRMRRNGYDRRWWNRIERRARKRLAFEAQLSDNYLE